MRSHWCRVTTLLAVALSLAACEQSTEIDVNPKLQSGYWRASIQLPGGDIDTGFDLIVANLYTKVILSIAPTLVAQLAPKGTLIISGILAERVGEVERNLEAVGCTLLRMDREGDWAVLVGSKTRG